MNGDGYVFYYKYQEGIIKIENNTEYQISDDQAYSLNYYDGYLYYVTMTSSGEIKIKKTDIDGNDNETLVSTSSSSTKMYLYDGYLYYLTSNPNTIAKIDIYGENETTILKRTVSNFEVEDETIYFTDSAGFLYSVDSNGENYTEIGDEVINSDFQIYGKYAYYYDEEQGLMKFNLNKLTTELVTDKLDSNIFNVTSDGIFFVNLENMKICKVSLNGSDYNELIDIDSTYSGINIANNRLYYIETDEDSSSYITCRIKTNGKATDDIEY